MIAVQVAAVLKVECICSGFKLDDDNLMKGGRW